MCAKGGNSVCLAVNCSEGQPKFKMFKKRIICRTDEFGLGNRMWEELTKIRVEGCVLKEEIVFVWL